MDVEYKRGLRIDLDDGTVIKIIKLQRGLYRVEGYYGQDYANKYLDMFYSPVYASLEGCKNYLKRNFDINLIY